nr:MAG TPA: hypothetical protein [Caudoviricetes sp.]
MKSRIAINYGLVTRGSGSCSLAVPGQSEQWHDLRPLDSECEQWRWQCELEYRLRIFLKMT